MNQSNKIEDSTKSTGMMPVLFVGHGSPMNAIENTEFSRGWRNAAETIEKPLGILCISAHWETAGTFITAMQTPSTIHDFGGFPEALFQVEYPAPGNPLLAHEIASNVKATHVQNDMNWGLDHGCWSVIRHMYPLADIPVVQLSIDYRKGALWHYNLAKELAFLRNKGILIVGSGNIVHNLRRIDWRNTDGGFDWANNANTLLKNLIISRDHTSLIEYQKLGLEVEYAIPTPEHFLPLIYILALQRTTDELTLFNDKTVMGSLAMTSVLIG